MFEIREGREQKNDVITISKMILFLKINTVEINPRKTLDVDLYLHMHPNLNTYSHSEDKWQTKSVPLSVAGDGSIG